MRVYTSEKPCELFGVAKKMGVKLMFELFIQFANEFAQTCFKTIIIVCEHLENIIHIITA